MNFRRPLLPGVWMGNACCRLGLTAVLTLMTGFAVPTAQAGVKIELTHQVTGINGASLSRRTLFFQGDQRRDETTVTFTSAWMRKLLKREGRSNVSKQIIIDQAGKNLEFGLDPSKNTYSEYPIYDAAYNRRGLPSPSSSTRTKPSHAAAVHTIEVKYEVEPTGHIKVINGFKAHEYRFVIQEEFEDRKTGQVSRVRNIETLWNSTDARVMAAYRDYMNYNRAVAKLWHTTLSMDMIQQLPMIGMPFDFFGKHNPRDPDPLSKLPGFPVQADTSWEAECLSHCKPQNHRAETEQAHGNSANAVPADRTDPRNSARTSGDHGIPVEMPIMHTQILSITLGKLPESLFTVPAGYTKKN